MIVRGIEFELKHYLNETELAKVEELLDSMHAELAKILENTELVKQLLKSEVLHSKGLYRNEFLGLCRPHDGFTSIRGNKAKYARILIERSRVVLLSLRERIHIAELCKNNNWVINAQLREKLTSENLYPTNALLKNICSSKSVPSIPRNVLAYLDYTVEDNQISTVASADNVLVTRIQVNGEWLEYSIPVPKTVRNSNSILKWSRPVIYHSANKQTEETTLKVRYSYFLEVPASASSTTRLGVDLGRIKPFTAASVTENGEYSTELAPSKELTRLSDKLNILQREAQRIYAKQSRITALLRGKNNAYLAQHYLDLEAQRQVLRGKMKRLREHASWVAARDIITHAVKENASFIHVENLSWVGSRAGKWDYAQVQDKLSQLAELHGLTIIKVNPYNSSRTDPFTGEASTPSSQRLTRTVVGELDRDYAASLELASRSGAGKTKRGVRKTRVVTVQRPVKGKCRDKSAPTPRRVKPAKRKSSLFKNSKVSGYLIAVGISGVVSAGSAPRTVRTVDNVSVTKYHQVQQT